MLMSSIVKFDTISSILTQKVCKISGCMWGSINHNTTLSTFSPKKKHFPPQFSFNNFSKYFIFFGIKLSFKSLFSSS